MKKRNLLIIITISLISLSVITYSKYKGVSSSNVNLNVAKFTYNVKNTEINLKNTITNEKELSPGAEGNFEVEIDLSNVEVTSEYEIKIDKTILPNNMHFYSDENKENEIISIKGTYLINNETTKKSKIYWGWKYVNNEESNTNDNLYMNKDIKVDLTLEVKQKVGDN